MPRLAGKTALVTGAGQGIGRAAARHHSEDKAGEEGMIEISDAAPFPPLRLLRALGCGHVRSLILVLPQCVIAIEPKQPTTHAVSSPDLIGRPSIPEAVVIDREAAAYWIPRLRGE